MSRRGNCWDNAVAESFFSGLKKERIKDYIESFYNPTRRHIVFGPYSVNRANFVFAEHKANIITSLNEGAKAIADLGLTAVLHQHTGTCIETRDETYAVMEAVLTARPG